MKKTAEKSDYSYTLDFQVRDYECDIQGIVNNSVYLNYLEHTRHEFLLANDISFHTLSKNNINLVVTRIEANYHAPLISGDKFWVGLSLQKQSKIRGVFFQDIIRGSDNKKIHTAVVHWASINEKGRPVYCEQLEPLFEAYAEKCKDE